MNIRSEAFLFILLGAWINKCECNQCPQNNNISEFVGEINFRPAPVASRKSLDCFWLIFPPRNKDFILLVEITYISAYDDDDFLYMADGSLLPHKTAATTMEALCFKFIVKDRNGPCLQELSRLYCQFEPLRNLIKALRISYSSRPRIQDVPNMYFYTNFVMKYNFVFCPSQDQADYIQLQSEGDEEELPPQPREGITPGLIVAFIIFHGSCLVIIFILILKILERTKFGHPLFDPEGHHGAAPGQHYHRRHTHHEAKGASEEGLLNDVISHHHADEFGYDQRHSLERHQSNLRRDGRRRSTIISESGKELRRYSYVRTPSSAFQKPRMESKMVEDTGSQVIMPETVPPMETTAPIHMHSLRTKLGIQRLSVFVTPRHENTVSSENISHGKRDSKTVSISELKELPSKSKRSLSSFAKSSMSKLKSLVSLGSLRKSSLPKGRKQSNVAPSDSKQSIIDSDHPSILKNSISEQSDVLTDRHSVAGPNESRESLLQQIRQAGGSTSSSSRQSSARSSISGKPVKHVSLPPIEEESVSGKEESDADSKKSETVDEESKDETKEQRRSSKSGSVVSQAASLSGTSRNSVEGNTAQEGKGSDQESWNSVQGRKSSVQGSRKSVDENKNSDQESWNSVQGRKSSVQGSKSSDQESWNSVQRRKSSVQGSKSSDQESSNPVQESRNSVQERSNSIQGSRHSSPSRASSPSRHSSPSRVPSPAPSEQRQTSLSPQPDNISPVSTLLPSNIKLADSNVEVTIADLKVLSQQTDESVLSGNTEDTDHTVDVRGPDQSASSENSNVEEN